MMKINLLALLILISACSTTHQTVYESYDGKLKEETLMLGNFQTANNNLAHCYKGEMGKFDQKMHAHFMKDPKDWRYWAIMGNCAIWRNKIRDAVFYLKSSLALAQRTEDKGTILSNLAVAYVRLGRHHKALNTTEEAFKILPKSKVVTFNLAQLYLYLNDPEPAYELLTKLQDAGGDEPEIWHLLGLTYLLKGAPKEATKYLSRLPASLQVREDVALTLADWRLAQGDWENAEKYLSRRRTSSFAGLEARAKELKRKADEIKNKKRFGP
jgi:tetratricopeptide (TPR) repeat protein